MDKKHGFFSAPLMEGPDPEGAPGGGGECGACARREGWGQWVRGQLQARVAAACSQAALASTEVTGAATAGATAAASATTTTATSTTTSLGAVPFGLKATAARWSPMHIHMGFIDTTQQSVAAQLHRAPMATDQGCCAVNIIFYVVELILISRFLHNLKKAVPKLAFQIYNSFKRGISDERSTDEDFALDKRGGGGGGNTMFIPKLMLHVMAAYYESELLARICMLPTTITRSLNEVVMSRAYRNRLIGGITGRYN